MNANTERAAVKAADVGAWLMEQAQNLGNQFPRENIYVSVNASIWPWATNPHPTDFPRWSVSIGTDPLLSAPTLDEAIRLASEAHLPAGIIQAKIEQIEKLRAEIRELDGKIEVST